MGELAQTIREHSNLAAVKLTPSHLEAIEELLPHDLAGRVRTLAGSYLETELPADKGTPAGTAAPRSR